MEKLRNMNKNTVEKCKDCKTSFCFFWVFFVLCARKENFTRSIVKLLLLFSLNFVVRVRWRARTFIPTGPGLRQDMCIV